MLKIFNLFLCIKLNIFKKIFNRFLSFFDILMNKAHELIKPISMDQFIAEHFLPLLKKVDDLTLSLKNEQEGNL